MSLGPDGALREQHTGPGRLHHLHVFCRSLNHRDDRQYTGGHSVHGHERQPGGEPHPLPHRDHQRGLVHTGISLEVSLLSLWARLNILLRFAGSPEKIVFLKDAMNIIDVLSIFPFFLDLFVLGVPAQE